MEKRRHNRFIISLPATIIIGGKTFDAVVSDVSEEGVASLMTTCVRTGKDFHVHNHVQTCLQLPNGETVHLQCEVRWFLRTPLKDNSLLLGLHIPDPPKNYLDWIGRFKP